MPLHNQQIIDIGGMAQQACLLEATVQKAGNVHPNAPFHDMAWDDFVRSAHAIQAVMARAAEQTLGYTILDAVQATQRTVEVNTNLGLILLLAPLCAVPLDESLEQGISRVIENTTAIDAELTYEAIRLASPAGLGEVDEADVRTKPNVNLLEAMKLAATRDAIAAEYAAGFHGLLHTIAPSFVVRLTDESYVDDAIALLHLECIARGDSLIARKLGIGKSTEVADRAKTALDSCHENKDAFRTFDAWLRNQTPRLNPGTSADLVGATIFIALRNGDLAPPFRWRHSLRSEPCGS